MKHLQTYQCALEEGLHLANVDRFLYFFWAKIPSLDYLREYNLIFAEDGKEYRRFENGKDMLLENIQCMLHGIQKNDRFNLGFEYEKAIEQDGKNFDVLVKKFLGSDVVKL